MPYLSKLKDYHLTYGGVIDKKQNEASGSLKLEKGTSSLLSFDAYIEGKNGIISLGDIYDKGIKTELEKVTDRKDELEQKYDNMMSRIEALENLTWEDAMKEY